MLKDKKIEDLLTSLHFVKWDRFVEFDDTIIIYGWIDKSDSRKDFVTLQVAPTVDYVTSSVKYSPIINKILGFTDEEHETSKCQRVENVFDIPNMIKL